MSYECDYALERNRAESLSGRAKEENPLKKCMLYTMHNILYRYDHAFQFIPDQQK